MERTCPAGRPSHRLAAIRLVIAAAVLTLTVAGCSVGARPSFALPAGAMAIPTDPSLDSGSDSHILCTLGATIPYVEGYLRGDPSDTAWPVWLEAADGHRQYVLWPSGFSVRFTPDPVLLDEKGAVVLTSGAGLELDQVGADPALGTRDHPYVASGLWSNSRCYHHAE
jgi:hypothetical protein